MFRVKCPVCGGLLTIDERLRKVVSHLSREDSRKDKGEQFEDIVDKVREFKSTQDDRLEAAKAREAERKKHVDELFKRAQKKAEESPDDDKQLGPVWD